MGSRSKQAQRCTRCRMHLQSCICRSIRLFPLETRLILVMHRREYKKPTATGPLALETLPNSEVRIQGHKDHPLDFSDLDTAERRTFLLYPGDDVPALSRTFLDKDPRPVTLVVPDGSWRQAAKMGRRLPGLQNAEMVTLPDGPRTNWGVRREHHAHGLATFEAIARAVGIIESPAAQSGMEELFRLMVQVTLSARGYPPVLIPGED